jgi:hypothetical protein
MSHYELDTALPKQQKELLLLLVAKARQYHVTSFHFNIIDSDGSFLRHFYIIFSADTKINDQLEVKLPENRLRAFEILGFLKYDDIANTIYLTPVVFKWADYEKKNRLGKFFAKHPFKDYMLALSVILSVSLTILQILGLTLLQVIETFRKLIYP